MSDDTIRRLRRAIIETAAKAGEGHIPSALSILDILWVLYDQVMAGRIIDPGDCFVLSKGHGCLAFYAVLAEKGYPLDLDTFCQPGSDLEGHPNRRIPGVECATGSLGHGLPMALGMAYALRLRQSPARVFCLVGDGECEEGSIWESAHLAARHKLSNLTMIVDANGTSPNRINGYRFVTSLAAKFAAFGWFTSEIPGHDHAAIRGALQPMSGDMPHAVIARTVKGYGCAWTEDEPQAWHHRSPREHELPAMLEACR